MRENELEHGIALIAVLALIATMGLLAASAVAISRYSAAEVDTFTSLQRSALDAESAANRALCLLLSDRSAHADRQLGEPDASGEERFLADGTTHEFLINGRPVTVRIFDAASGIDISGNNPARQLSTAFPSKKQDQALETLADCLRDYVDRDELVRTNGMEAPRYRAAGIPELPRNQPLQFREELLWIPEGADRIPANSSGCLDRVRIIAPEGLPPLSGRPNLYAENPAGIANRCQLNEEETGQLIHSLKLWKNERKPLSTTLPPGLFGRLKIYYSVRESGIYTIAVDTASPEYPGGRFRMTIRPSAVEFMIEYYEFLHD